MLKYSFSLALKAGVERLMELNRKLEQRSYFLSNKNCFFHRFADTGFKNKWTGFWSNGKKFIEFIAFRVNEEFLSEANCTGFEYDYVKAIHSHKLKDNTKIKQAIWTPKEKAFCVAELSAKKPIEAELLVAVNIRKIDENLRKRKYKVKQGQTLEISNKLGLLSVTSLKGTILFEQKPVYRIHNPKGEKQNYFLPGLIKLKGKNIAVQFSAGKNKN